MPPTTFSSNDATPRVGPPPKDSGMGHPWIAMSWLLFVALLAISPALVIAGWRVLL